MKQVTWKHALFITLGVIGLFFLNKLDEQPFTPKEVVGDSPIMDKPEPRDTVLFKKSKKVKRTVTTTTTFTYRDHYKTYEEKMAEHHQLEDFLDNIDEGAFERFLRDEDLDDILTVQEKEALIKKLKHQ